MKKSMKGIDDKKSNRNHALTVPVEKVLAFRVQRHNLDSKESREFAQLAGACGIHAQVMSAALAQFWARTKGIGPEDMHDRLWKKRTLVKTWCMRGTLHIVPKGDLDVFAGARRRVSTDRETQWMKYFRVSYSDLDEVTLVGPQRGGENTFLSPKDWLKSWRIRLTPEESRVALLERYLRVYGPSDRLEFAAWAGLDPINAKPTWESMLDKMIEVAYCGRRTWLLEDDLDALLRSEFRDTVRLIPNFDVYLAGRDRGVLTSSKGEHKKVYREAGWVSAVILLQGKVGGVWSAKTQKDKLLLNIESFVELGSDFRRSVEEEAEAYADFLDSLVRGMGFEPMKAYATGFLL